MTKATDARPTKRLTMGVKGDLIVEISANLLRVRPPRTRRGGPAEIAVTPRWIYEQALLRRVAPLARGRA